MDFKLDYEVPSQQMTPDQVTTLSSYQNTNNMAAQPFNQTPVGNTLNPQSTGGEKLNNE